MTTKRRIIYVTGTRADFGLMRSTLARIDADDRLDLELLVTGMHLDQTYGHTVDEIERSGLSICGRVPVGPGETTGAQMAINLGHMLREFVPVLVAARPDIVLLLGDRGEMLAGAIAALHLNIAIAHVHGGERSGTVDEPVRHAISKLSSLHLVATAQSRTRLIAMGEAEANVHIVGGPGIDGLSDLPRRDRRKLTTDLGLDEGLPVALLVFHPVLHEAVEAGDHIMTVVQSLLEEGVQVVAVKPNSDAGSTHVRSVLEAFAATNRIHLFTHLERPEFVELMAAADVMVGNSSSGIIEASTFGTPVINIGPRQYLRERNLNVVDVGVDSDLIRKAITTALRNPRFPRVNVYGDGHAGDRIAEILATVDLEAMSHGKINAY